MPEERPCRKTQDGKPVLTARELKFLKAYLRSGNQRQSALAAGYSQANPDQVATKVMKQLQRKVPELLENVNFEVSDMLRKVLVPGLEAKKTIYFTHKGVVTDSLECPDNKHRLKCLILSLKLLGHKV